MEDVQCMGRSGQTVSREGAPAGSFLHGFSKSNAGIRLQVVEAQPRGAMGAVKGDFVILDVGNNWHSDSLRPMLDLRTDADEIGRIIRRKSVSCVNVVNVNILVCEDNETTMSVLVPNRLAPGRRKGHSGGLSTSRPRR